MKLIESDSRHNIRKEQKDLNIEITKMKRILQIRIMISSKTLRSTAVFNIGNNVSWAANQHIRMISEGSCDTEDWSNYAENS